MLILIGYIVIVLSVFGGFALAGGHLKAIIQPIELLIITGAAIGSLIVGNQSSVLKAIFKALPTAFKSQKSNKVLYMDLLGLLYTLLNKGRQEGMMALEADIDAPENSAIFSNYPRLLTKKHVIEFICDYFRLIITSNMQPFQLESLMDSEIATYHQEELIPVNAITKLADGMPAFGIVAAVLGVVHTMESINLPPAELGILVAQALVGTFLGILLGYGFIGPIATAIEQRSGETLLMMNCIKVTLLASVSGNPPLIATEFGRKVLFSTARPSFNELNEGIKPVKADTADAA
ncbi:MULTISPECIES: flagellar motor stator protein MotA [Legionella]|uniref:Flagellar motor protein MotA n=1 Tax=Legionella drozanskii LLAP-1 TaxID=1212489 RepID=A0A0W0SRF0_9GAMM|nr:MULTISPECIES: flagellar motor stator protein MotA [Legionella]KTC85860.1 flagellar motor protein MotA [Legionella drozanskii LLAP-1]PJE10900.1 MAG: flagellar motor stator protein MotA [Legionella sp.]